MSDAGGLYVWTEFVVHNKFKASIDFTIRSCLKYIKMNYIEITILKLYDKWNFAFKSKKLQKYNGAYSLNGI